MKKTLAIILVLVMMVCVFSATAAAADKTVTIKLGFTHANPDRNVDDEVMYAETFKEYVESHSDTIKVELYPGNALGSQADTVGAVASGTVEMTIQNSSQLNNYDVNTMIFGMPGTFSSIEETNKVLDTDWAKDLMAASAEITGIRVLGNSCTGMRSFTCKGHEIRSVEDAAGLTFRVPESAIYIEIVKAIGANPVPMPSSEMYVAMQNGVVDGQENPIQNVVIDKTYEVQDWIVMDEHIPSMSAVYFNEALYESLSDNQKKVIDDAAATAQAAAREVVTAILANGIETLQNNGMTVYIPTDAEKEAWHEAYGPYCEKYLRGVVGDQIVNEFQATIAANR